MPNKVALQNDFILAGQKQPKQGQCMSRKAAKAWLLEENSGPRFGVTQRSETSKAKVEGDAFPLLLLAHCLYMGHETWSCKCYKSCQQHLPVQNGIQGLCGVVDYLLLQGDLLVHCSLVLVLLLGLGNVILDIHCHIMRLQENQRSGTQVS